MKLLSSKSFHNLLKQAQKSILRQSFVLYSIQLLIQLDPYTQPLEPIFIPKLQIYFADFPYSHYSVN